MRGLVALLLLPLLSGCLAGSDSEAGASDAATYRTGVVLVNAEFLVNPTQQNPGFEVTFESGTRNVVLEIQQDSGVMPNLHVEIGGCGEVDPPASAAWQSYSLCETAAAGDTVVVISIKSGAPSGTGRFLVRADVPT